MLRKGALFHNGDPVTADDVKFSLERYRGTAGSYPDIDGLFREQAADADPKRREATLHRIQQLVHEKVIYAPIWELAFLNGVGPRVRESGLGLINGHAYSAPYEDITLKGK